MRLSVILASGPLALTASMAMAQQHVDLACWDGTFFYREFALAQVSDGFELSMAGLDLGNIKLRSRNLQDAVSSGDLGYAKGIHVKFAPEQCHASDGEILCSDSQIPTNPLKDRIFVERPIQDLDGYLDVISGFPVSGIDFEYKAETGATLVVFEGANRKPAGTLSVSVRNSERNCDIARRRGVQFPQRLRDFLVTTGMRP